ncbi:MAG: lipase family protein [Schwartzia sp.]|nr:lipase family protein [Schwartzia sp. (in: firmicutes)]MBR1759948.1 lipase family protein [Schwartzia sp. (in: firmicutes)]
MARKGFQNFSRFASGALLACALCFAPAGAQAANTGGYESGKSAVYEEASVSHPPLEYFCSLISLASYSDRVGLVARESLADSGWALQPYREDTEKVAAKYYFMKNENPLRGGVRYLVSVTGTSDLKDIKADLSMGKIPFAGKTPDEFEKEMKRGKMNSSEPLTHGGFTHYTQTAFFSHRENGKTFGEELKDILANDPDAKLCITGHSLGGAVAVLFAARLMAMGVSTDQLDIVTFGAPAVGNRAFAEAYSDMPLTRIAMTGDPIHAAVQAIDTSYVQFGGVQHWSRPRGSERFQHDMTGYADVALRRFFDFVTEKRREAERFQEDGVPYEGDAMRARKTPGEGGEALRVLLFADYTLDDAIIDDLPYMRLAAFDILSREMGGLVASRTAFSSLPGENKVAEAVRQAKEMGCRYVLIQKYASERLKHKRSGYKISLEEALYDARGNPLVLQGFATNTDTMTPIIAALYNEVAGREARRTALAKK